MTTGYGGDGVWKFWIFLIAAILLIAFGMLLHAYFSIVPADQTNAITVPPTVVPDPQERKNEALEEQRRLRQAEEMAELEANIVYILVIVIAFSALVLVFAFAVRIARHHPTPDPHSTSPPGSSGDGASADRGARQEAPPQQQYADPQQARQGAPAGANGSGQAAPLYTPADTRQDAQDRPATVPESEPDKYRLVLRRIETRPASG
ncbi:MAG: NADH-quinone oxidoreductase subunit K, partial [Anaerolineae bacterium]|nr:NADH-quinone oxidoreductase subunit K [Anaerolineae bacterium]